MKFKLPKLQTFLNGDKKISDSDPTKSIHVSNGHAIVSNNIVAIVDLRNYVKRELNVIDENELEELTSILDWMEGKSFSKDFWSELTGERFVTLTEDGLSITHESYISNLNYFDRDTDIKHALKILKDNLMRPEKEMSRFALSGDHFSLLTKGFSNELKGDNFIFKLSGSGNTVLFSLQRRDYIFGIIPEHFDSSMDLTAFLNAEGLHEEIVVDSQDNI